MKPLNIYVVRHGQTYFNTCETVQGWNDSPLTETGIFQARCTGYGLKDIPFARAYCGDLERQYDTARYVLMENSLPHTPIIQTPCFREMCYGKFQGGCYQDMLDPLFAHIGVPYGGFEVLEKHMTASEISHFIATLDESVEKVEQVQRRMLEGLEMIISDSPEGGNILLATSSACLDDMFAMLFPDFHRGGLVDNASVSIIRYLDGYYHLISYNDTSYRDKGQAALSAS